MTFKHESKYKYIVMALCPINVDNNLLVQMFHC